MNKIIVFGMVWIACGVVAYLTFRADWRKSCGEWRTGPRMLALVLSLTGPCALGAAAMSYLASCAGKDRAAKW